MEEAVNRFNLIDEPWIPVANEGRVSLKRVFSDPELKALGGDAVQKIALMKLLQAICQAAATPENNTQWQQTGPDGLCKKVLAYLNRWRDSFWLYGNTPFLQMPEIKRAELKPFGTVLPAVSTGNTTVLTQSQTEKPLSDADKALLLIVQMSMALGGKKTDNRVVLSQGYTGKTNEKGKPATGKAGSALGFKGMMHHFCLGANLQQTCWLNLFTQQDIAALTQYPAGLGVAPWEAMPEGENCARAKALKQSLMGRLVPMGRFCLLTESGLHYSEGISHSGYKEGLYDPSLLVNKKGKELKVLWADPARRPWRELPSLLTVALAQQSEWECEQLHFAISKACREQLQFGVWSGGLRVSSNAGEQFLTGTDDVVESLLWIEPDLFGESWFNHFKGEMLALDGLAKRLFGCVSGWYREMKVDAKSIAPQATELFWQRCEQQAQALLDGCMDADQRQRLRHQFAAFLYQTFDHFCPSQTARQLDAWAKTRPNLADYLKNASLAKESI
ncbi:type I-E CRISPR-associated protein Cse1/CasA [Franconibacter pulveris]